MNTEPEHNTIILEQRRNIMLTCDVQYAYPAANIEWNITSSSGHFVAQQNTGGNLGYTLYNNGSIEIYHQLILEEGHIVVVCSATNIHGSNKKIFQLRHHTFIESMHYIKLSNKVTIE